MRRRKDLTASLPDSDTDAGTRNRDLRLMDAALEQAHAAAASGEAPVGAILYDPDTDSIVARAHNRPIGLCDPTAHSEILALRAGAELRGNYRLNGLWLYATLEPCAMCAGAMSHARIGRLIFGASDPKVGAVLHGPLLFEQPTCHWRPAITFGLRETEAATLLRDFFRARRKPGAQW